MLATNRLMFQKVLDGINNSLLALRIKKTGFRSRLWLLQIDLDPGVRPDWQVVVSFTCHVFRARREESVEKISLLWSRAARFLSSSLCAITDTKRWSSWWWWGHKNPFSMHEKSSTLQSRCLIQLQSALMTSRRPSSCCEIGACSTHEKWDLISRRRWWWGEEAGSIMATDYKWHAITTTKRRPELKGYGGLSHAPP